MASIKRLVKRFMGMNPDYTMELDELESTTDYIVVYVVEPVCGTSARYTFSGDKGAAVLALRDWINGVVLD